MDIIKNL